MKSFLLHESLHAGYENAKLVVLQNASPQALRLIIGAKDAEADDLLSFFSPRVPLRLRPFMGINFALAPLLLRPISVTLLCSAPSSFARALLADSFALSFSERCCLLLTESHSVPFCSVTHYLLRLTPVGQVPIFLPALPFTFRPEAMASKAKPLR